MSHLEVMMSGLDTLIAKPLNSTIRENLGKKTLEKVEARLFEKYGINLTQSIEDFTKFHKVLREFFGDGAEGLERKFLENIVTVEETKNQDPNWTVIEDPCRDKTSRSEDFTGWKEKKSFYHITMGPSLAKQILEALGDEDKKNILYAVLDEPRIISEILEITHLPQTSGYKKVNSLIVDGLLIVQGHAITNDGKKVNKYKSVFNDVKISIVENKVIVKMLLAKEPVEKSALIQIVR